jgi:hypothetical protein
MPRSARATCRCARAAGGLPQNVDRLLHAWRGAGGEHLFECRPPHALLADECQILVPAYADGFHRDSPVDKRIALAQSCQCSADGSPAGGAGVAGFSQSGGPRPWPAFTKLFTIKDLRLAPRLHITGQRLKKMKKGLLILVGVMMALAPMTSSAAVRVVVGGGYYGGFYSPFWGSYWGPGYYAYPNSGEVKLDTKVKDAQVFIDGAYAGTSQQNKTMHLRPGSYNIEIREAGRTQYSETVYVVAGKTLHLHAAL